MDAPWRKEALRRAFKAGVRIVMVHVGDPDRWWRTMYQDTAKFGKVNTITWRGADGTMQVRLDPIAMMPDELKEAIKAEANGQLPDELT